MTGSQLSLCDGLIFTLGLNQYLTFYDVGEMTKRATRGEKRRFFDLHEGCSIFSERERNTEGGARSAPAGSQPGAEAQHLGRVWNVFVQNSPPTRHPRGDLRDEVERCTVHCRPAVTSPFTNPNQVSLGSSATEAKGRHDGMQ